MNLHCLPGSGHNENAPERDLMNCPLIEAKNGISVAHFSIIAWGGTRVEIKKFHEVQAWRVYGSYLFPIVSSFALTESYLKIFDPSPKSDFGWLVRSLDESYDPPFIYAIGGSNKLISGYVNKIEPGPINVITQDLKDAGSEYWKDREKSTA